VPLSEEEIEALVEKLDEVRAIKDSIIRHLRRQIGVENGFIRWDDNSLHRVGEDEDDYGTR
jgi:hypothetical protein